MHTAACQGATRVLRADCSAGYLGAGSGLNSAASEPRTPRMLPCIDDAAEASLLDGLGGALWVSGQISCLGSEY